MADEQISLAEQAGPWLAQRASQWFEQQGMLLQAIEAAFLAGNVEQTIGLIERFMASSRYKEEREYHMLFRWLQRIPLDQLKRSPALCLGYAMTLWCAAPTDQLDRQTLVLIRELLSAAEVGFAGEENRLALGEVLAVRALTSWRHEALPQAVEDARQALSLLPTRELLWRSISEHILGVEALARGQLSLARRIFEQTLASGQSLLSGNTTGAAARTWGKRMFSQTTTALLAWTCLQQGQLRQATEYYQQIVDQAYETDHHAEYVYALLGLGWIAFERNELGRAAELFQEATLLGRHQIFAAYQVWSTLRQARLLDVRGDTASALQLLAEFQDRQVQLSPHFEHALLVTQARLHLRRGNLAAAQKELAASERRTAEDLPRFQYEQAVLLHARFYLAQGQSQEVLRELQVLLEDMPERQHSRNALELQALLVLAEAAQGQEDAARQRLRHLVTLARPEGYMRIFLDEGQAMASLLQQIAASTREKMERAYLQQIAEAFAAEALRPSHTVERLVEPLSPQELRVLNLLATGASAPQIARQLIVSVTTVRTQIQSIYRKLQVNNRVAAISAARHLRLL